MTKSSNILRPQISLHPDDLLSFLGSQTLCRVQTVHFRYIHKTTDTKRFVINILRLIIIKISVIIRHHHHLVSSLCSFNTTRFSSPRHNDRCLRNIPLQYFIPTDNSLALLLQIRLDPVNGIILQFPFFLHFLLFHPGLTLLTLFPSIPRTLVTPDMDDLSGKQFRNLIQHAFPKLKRFLVTGAKYFRKHAPHLTHLVRSTRTSQFRISSQSGKRMPGKLYFRNNRDIPIGSILNNLFNLFLCEKVRSVWSTVIFSGIFTNHGLFPLTSNLREFRVFLYLDTPPLVIRQMPVEHAQLMQSQHIDKSLHLIHREKMTTHVQHCSPVP